MKKRLVSVFLCALMLISAVVGCGKKPAPTPAPTAKDLFFEAAASLKDVKESKYTASIDMKIPADASKDFAQAGILGDISNLKLDISGSSSPENKQLAADISATISGSKGETKFKLTDFLADDQKVYINFHTIFDFMMSMQGGSSAVQYSSLFKSDYFGTSLEELSSLTGQAIPNSSYPIKPESIPKCTALLSRVSGVLKNSLKEESFAANGDTYTLTMKTPDIIDIAKAVVKDIDANAGEYADAMIEYNKSVPGAFDSMDIDVDGLSRDELIAELKKAASEFTADLEKEDKISNMTMTVTLGKDSAAKSYNMGFSISVPDEAFELKAKINIVDTKIEKITSPADYLTINDLMPLLYVF